MNVIALLTSPQNQRWVGEGRKDKVILMEMYIDFYIIPLTHKIHSYEYFYINFDPKGLTF
jgi:hypothetical protein